MFGGVGLYSGELFFGLIDDDTLFFKTGESNSAEYQARKMPRFMPPANRPLGPMGYHQVPADIIEDGEALVAWARKAVAVALAARAQVIRGCEAKARVRIAKKKPPRRPKAGAAGKAAASSARRAACAVRIRSLSDSTGGEQVEPRHT